MILLILSPLFVHCRVVPCGPAKEFFFVPFWTTNWDWPFCLVCPSIAIMPQTWIYCEDEWILHSRKMIDALFFCCSPVSKERCYLSQFILRRIDKGLFYSRLMYTCQWGRKGCRSTSQSGNLFSPKRGPNLRVWPKLKSSKSGKKRSQF
jgi:hypothetical protein